MKYYYFSGRDHTKDNKISTLEENGFSGALFIYQSWCDDFITKAANDADSTSNMVYMVAMRPYAISPQYLVMLSNSMHDIMPDRFQFNLISGHIKDREKPFGGMPNSVNDQSSHIERSNYLIDYLKELDKMYKLGAFHRMPDFFVSTTNEYVFETASVLKNKMIISYLDYKNKRWRIYEDYQNGGDVFLGKEIDLSNQKVMISIAPIIRDTVEEIEILSRTQRSNDTEYFTYQEFYHFVETLKSKGIEYLLISPYSEEEEDYIYKAIKELTFGDKKNEIS